MLFHGVFGRYGIYTAPARGTVFLFLSAHAGLEPLDAEIAQRIGTNVLGDLLDAAGRRDQFLGVGKVDPVVAGVSRGRAGDPQVNLLRSGLAE